MIGLMLSEDYGMVISIAIWKNRGWKTANRSEISCRWGRQCLISSNTESLYRQAIDPGLRKTVVQCVLDI